MSKKRSMIKHVLTLKHRQTGFTWKGHNFVIESSISQKYLFLASQERIYMDGKLILEHGGFNFKTKESVTFLDEEGIEHCLEFRCSSFMDTWLPLSIMIDGNLVYKGGVPVKGIFASILIYFPIFFFVVLFILYAFDLISISLSL